MYANRTAISTKLRDAPIADTQDGTAWAIKALHPADHESVPRGMPTRDATSVVTMQFQRETTIQVPEQIEGVWDVDIWTFRDPVLLGCYIARARTASGETVEWHAPIFNTQIGEDFNSCVIKLQELCEAVRVSYASTTGHLIAPALADQGSVRCALYEYPPFIRPYVPANASNLVTTNVVTYIDPLIEYKDLIQMPNAYQNVAKEGFYMPMKMTEEDMRWTRTNQTYILWGRTVPTNSVQAEFQAADLWPYFDTSGQLMAGYVMGTIIGHTSFRGLSSQASLNLIHRVGLDMKVRPSTVYSPFNHEPPVYDQLAIKMYFEIARRMADAYPASYNASGALLGVVAEIAKALWPIVEPQARILLDKLSGKINSTVQKVANKIGVKRVGNDPKKVGGPKKVEDKKGEN